LGHAAIVFQESRFDMLVASLALVDVDVDGDGHVKVDITNAHLETAVVVAANDLCVADIRIVAGLNAIGIGGAAILGAARAVVPLTVRVSSARRRAIVAAILSTVSTASTVSTLSTVSTVSTVSTLSPLSTFSTLATLFIQSRQLWPGDIPKLRSSGLDVTSLNLGNGLVDGRRHNALQEGKAVEEGRKVHDCVV
jgi:hypothetical protein